MKAKSIDLDRLVTALGTRSIVLVGIMGCGKSTVGKRLAQRLGLEFVDADSEIERAANMTVSEIFAEHGESYFRSGEERVIARLLGEGPQVLATGGGAFMSDTTRSEISENGLSVWLKVDFETVMARVRRRSTRPLLQTPDPEGTMRKLLAEREPIYARAALTVTSEDVPHDMVVDQILVTMANYLFQDEGQLTSQTSIT
ncbi:shikimate kinase [Roseibium sp. MMSF_3544]|uniref:shikimate kinase n=1 Tax=unclassified Roseibium TaxID=2629323 RepID=UPI00273DCBCA|nr:shikimate kinase [Roseibium sp. MMSF_3544]